MAKQTAGAKPKKESTPTEYHVLRLAPGVPGDESTTEAPDRWEIVATLAASGAKQAKRTYFKTAAAEAARTGTIGEFRETLVAVPTGSWKPEPLGVELDIRIVVG